MSSDSADQVLVDKISQYETIFILVNEKNEMEFEGIIDAPYIKMHFDRVVKSCRDFDIVKLVGVKSTKSKELIAEVIVSHE